MNVSMESTDAHLCSSSTVSNPMRIKKILICKWALLISLYVRSRAECQCWLARYDHRCVRRANLPTLFSFIFYFAVLTYTVSKLSAAPPRFLFPLLDLLSFRCRSVKCCNLLPSIHHCLTNITHEEDNFPKCPG